MDKFERISLIKAMEFIARNVNDQNVFSAWLLFGVADGDIEYGDIAVKAGDEFDLDCYYRNDEVFAQLMDVFIRVMANAKESGGLYCDGVVSKSGIFEEES